MRSLFRLLDRFAVRSIGLSALLCLAALGSPAPARADAGAAPAAKTVLVVGDSLSAEYGIARGTGWVPLLGRRLAERYPNYRVINASIS
ncbi:MAG TPA: arylesterase, partial [Bordetella sp.]